MTLLQKKTQLEQIENALLELAINGSSVAITGSHSYTSADYPTLEKMRKRLTRDILRLSGYQGTIQPDFGGK